MKKKMLARAGGLAAAVSLLIGSLPAVQVSADGIRTG